MSRSVRQQPARRFVRPGKSAEWSLGAAGRIMMREERIEADWRGRAACKDHDPGLFDSADPDDVDLAKYICAGCPVIARCRDFAAAMESGMGVELRSGTWASRTAAERWKLDQRTTGTPGRSLQLQDRRQRRAVPAAAPELTQAELARFRSLVQPGACGLAWDGAEAADGTGIFEVTRDGAWVSLRAHRVAYRLLTGRDPGTDEPWQKCGRPLCCTPACLAPATSAADVPAGETRRGEAQRRKAA